MRIVSNFSNPNEQRLTTHRIHAIVATKVATKWWRGGTVMLNMPTAIFDTPVRGFSNVTDEDAYTLEQKSGANHYDRLNSVIWMP
jgi:hypothetical protein